ncbi:hypothetical protein ACFL3S_03680 [Gemmatimonadota bacterium]
MKIDHDPQPAGDLSEESKRLFLETVAHEPARWNPPKVALLNEGLRARDRAEEARRTLAAQGVTFTSDSGVVHVHPAVRIEKDSTGIFIRVWNQLGLNWR